MRIVVGLLCSALWLVYAGQLVSVVKPAQAQRLGVQEKPDAADPLFSRLELWTAGWDLCWLWTLPAAGILMLIDHAWWPYAAMVGGGAYVDTGGREAAKVLGLRQGGLRTGSPGEQRLAMSAYAFFVGLGGIAISIALVEVSGGS